MASRQRHVDPLDQHPGWIDQHGNTSPEADRVGGYCIGMVADCTVSWIIAVSVSLEVKFKPINDDEIR